MNNNNMLSMQMQCISDIIFHFKWPKVTVLYEQTNTFSSVDLGIITQFSDSLKKSTNSVIDHHLGFPPIFSLNEPEQCIQQELKKLKKNSTRVFVILQASLEFAKVLFKKANEEGMMKQGYVWIISDDLASSLESMEPSHIENMQGVIGIKTHFSEENTKPHKDFRLKFLRKFITEYSDDHIFSPSKYAFKAYDAIGVLGKAMEISKLNISSRELTHQILSSDFEGLSGRLRFKNGFLSQKIVFSIVNVICKKSYREVSKWEEKDGFFEDSGEGLNKVFWPGGEQETPLGYSVKKQLKIAVPKGACEQIVKVSFDKEKNKTSFSGFSVRVFEAAVSKLGYHLGYDLFQFNGTYSDMVKAVNNKLYHAAIGDITILANRYDMVDFSLPYVETSIVMIVPATSGISKERFAVMKAFKLQTWLVMATMNIFTAAVIYLNENINGNPDFAKDSSSQHIGAVFWLSITIYTLSQSKHCASSKLNKTTLGWLKYIYLIVIYHVYLDYYFL
ncbi:transmembrane signal receptor [Lithospermum erythrorhizon]|uniref:Transmembrane signal receptor n=1 Tax=Lithospermum erythrorhizon TaxID=34254 RepID=A0AAV3NQT3_LITER